MSERRQEVRLFDEAVKNRPWLELGLALDSRDTKYRENFIHFTGRGDQDKDSIVVVSASDASTLPVDVDELQRQFVNNPENYINKTRVFDADGRANITFVEREEIKPRPVQTVMMTFLKSERGFLAELGRGNTLVQPMTYGEAASKEELYSRKQRQQTLRDLSGVETAEDERYTPDELTQDVLRLKTFTDKMAQFDFFTYVDGERVDIDVKEVLEYIASGRLAEHVKSKGIGPGDNEYTYRSASMMALANALHAKLMAIHGIPGVSLAISDEGKRPNKYVRIGSEEAEQAKSLVGAFTAQTRSPADTINSMNIDAYFENPGNPDYPFPADVIDELLAEHMQNVIAPELDMRNQLEYGNAEYGDYPHPVGQLAVVASEI